MIGVKQSQWTSEIYHNGVEKRGSWSQLHAFAAEADIVILTCTQTAATRGMVDAAFLAACKVGVVIINVARGGAFQPNEMICSSHNALCCMRGCQRRWLFSAGGLLDYDAVKEGLESGKIGALGLDVQWQEPIDPEDYFARHPRCCPPQLRPLCRCECSTSTAFSWLLAGWSLDM